MSFYPAHHITMGEGGAVLTIVQNLNYQLIHLETGVETAGVKVVTMTPVTRIRLATW